MCLCHKPQNHSIQPNVHPFATLPESAGYKMFSLTIWIQTGTTGCECSSFHFSVVLLLSYRCNINVF